MQWFQYQVLVGPPDGAGRQVSRLASVTLVPNGCVFQ